MILGTCGYLYATFPANTVVNDTTDKTAYCEMKDFRGGHMKPVDPGDELEVYGVSCAVEAEGRKYFGCLVLPDANRLKILVSSARTDIPTSACGSGYAPELNNYLTPAP